MYVSKALNVLKTLKYKHNRATLNSLYKSNIRPLMEYADVIWDGCSEGEPNILETVQYEAARVVTGTMKGTNKRQGWRQEFPDTGAKVPNSVAKLGVRGVLPLENFNNLKV